VKAKYDPENLFRATRTSYRHPLDTPVLCLDGEVHVCLDFRNEFTILIPQHSLLMVRLQTCPSGIPEVDPDEQV
jgi:hypothetical protein